MFITPAVAGGRVFIGSCSGKFLAFDAATGTELWSYDTATDGDSAQFHGDPLVTDEVVVVGSDSRLGYVYAFERATGRVRWKLSFPHGVPGQVLGRGAFAYVTTSTGEVAAVELRSGTIAWLYTEGYSSRDLGMIQTDAALDGDRLFVGWRNGQLDALDASNGQRLWRAELGSPVSTSVVTFGSTVFAGTLNGQLHRLAGADGRNLGTPELGGKPYGDLVATDRCVFVLTASGDGHKIMCVDPARGTPTWTRAFPTEISTFRPLARGAEVIAGRDRELFALRTSDGSDVWSCGVTGTPRGLGTDGDHVFLGTLGGTVMAFPALPCQGHGSASPTQPAARNTRTQPVSGGVPGSMREEACSGRARPDA